MGKTDVFLQDSGDREYIRSRAFKFVLHDLQRVAEKYGVDFVLFVEDSEDTETAHASADMTFGSSDKMFDALGTCPKNEDEKKLVEVGFQ